MHAKLARAKARRTIKDAKRSSWRQYVKSNIHQYVTNKCQSVWEKQTENKLHELKPDFNSKCAF